jgi:hypothetical protein
LALLPRLHQRYRASFYPVSFHHPYAALLSRQPDKLIHE